jgi:integrase/recombinase XerC
MHAIDLRSAGKLEAALQRAWRHKSLAKARDALAMSLGLCGLRWAEVVKVRLRDIDEVQGRLSVRSAKGGVRRVLPVSSYLCESLRLLVVRGHRSRAAQIEDLVFTTRSGEPLRYEQIRRRTREWTRRVTGRSYSFHCLRHTAALRAYESTRDVLAVQRLLGHRSLRWTEEYLRSVQAVEARTLSAFATGERTTIRLFDPGRASA